MRLRRLTLNFTVVIPCPSSPIQMTPHGVGREEWVGIGSTYQPASREKFKTEKNVQAPHGQLGKQPRKQPTIFFSLKHFGPHKLHSKMSNQFVSTSLPLANTKKHVSNIIDQTKKSVSTSGTCTWSLTKNWAKEAVRVSLALPKIHDLRVIVPTGHTPRHTTRHGPVWAWGNHISNYQFTLSPGHE